MGKHKKQQCVQPTSPARETDFSPFRPSGIQTSATCPFAEKTALADQSGFLPLFEFFNPLAQASHGIG